MSDDRRELVTRIERAMLATLNGRIGVDFSGIMPANLRPVDLSQTAYIEPDPEKELAPWQAYRPTGHGSVSVVFEADRSPEMDAAIENEMNAAYGGFRYIVTVGNHVYRLQVSSVDFPTKGPARITYTGEWRRRPAR